MLVIEKDPDSVFEINIMWCLEWGNWDLKKKNCLNMDISSEM